MANYSNLKSMMKLYAKAYDKKVFHKKKKKRPKPLREEDQFQKFLSKQPKQNRGLKLHRRSIDNFVNAKRTISPNRDVFCII